MDENKVKGAFDRIEPEAGAQERMYANILKKAAAQTKGEAVERPEKENQGPPLKRPAPFQRGGVGEAWRHA